MKRYIYFIPLLIIFLSCHREEVDTFSVHELSIILNGEPWGNDSITLTYQPHIKQINALWNVISGDSAVDIFIGRVKNQIYEKQIYHRVPINPRDYYLIDKQPSIKNDSIVKVSYSSLISGDAIESSYKIVEAENNYITVGYFDASVNIISGKLNVTFINTNDEKDTLRFTNGNFRVTIEDGQDK